MTLDMMEEIAPPGYADKLRKKLMTQAVAAFLKEHETARDEDGPRKPL